MPLFREMANDMPLLVNDPISRVEREKRGSIRLATATLESLCRDAWPGNVRELANLIERLVILFPYGVVEVQDLPLQYRSPRLPDDEGDAGVALTAPTLANSMQALPREGLDLKKHLAHMEQALIKQALDDAGGVVAHAAKRLCMGRTTPVEKMKKLGIHRPEELR
jgi:sigma-54 specific flagellar transcriptional regulator A